MSETLAIIAGQGPLPERVVGAVRDAGRDVFILAFDGITDPGLVADHRHRWVRLGEVGKAFDALRSSGAKEVVMIGSVGRPTLSSLRLDWRGIRLAARLGSGGQSDKEILDALVGELEREGFRVVGADDLLDSLLTPEGPLTEARPDATAEADIALGVRVAHRLGELDIGQAVVVQQGLVLGVEAIEGTDRLLERCAELRLEGPGGVLVKLKKPAQDRRIDLPTIGPRTVAEAHRAGLRGIAVEHGNSLIAFSERTVAEANEAGLFIVGIAADG